MLFERPSVTREISLAQYRSYQGLVQQWFREINPLLEHDHVRFYATLPQLDGDPAEHFIDRVSLLGPTAAYPYNLNGRVLGLTVFANAGAESTHELLGHPTHSKIRCYFDPHDRRLTLVPMVFPDLRLRPGGIDSNELWSLLKSHADEAGVHSMEKWQNAASELRQPERLTYELLCHCFASRLAEVTVSKAAADLRNAGGPMAFAPDISDLSRRFGPELAPLVERLMDSPSLRDHLVRALMDAFVAQPELPLPAMKSRPRLPTGSTIPLYELCEAIISGLKAAFVQQDMERTDPLDDRQGWTYEEILNEFSTAPAFLVSQAVDYLCDNAFIVPWFSKQSGDMVGRRYRTAEYTELKIGFDLATELIGFTIVRARARVRTMDDGVRLTFLNKLLTNILYDLETMLSREDIARLEAIFAKPGLYGPEVKISHLLTRHRPVSLASLGRYGFVVSEKIDAKGRAHKVIREEADKKYRLRGFDKPVGKLIEDLTQLYIQAHSKLGGQVQTSLLPLSIYRFRDEAYAYLHTNLHLWLEAVLIAKATWPYVPTRNRWLKRCADTLRSYEQKVALAPGFPALWGKFIALAEDHSIVLADALDEELDRGAVDMTLYATLHTIKKAFRELHQALVLASQGRPIDGATRSGIDAALESAGVDRGRRMRLSERMSSGETYEWAEMALDMAAKLLNSAPEPVQHVAKLRERRRHEKNIANLALERMKASGASALYILMGDLLHSKHLSGAAEALDIDYLEDVVGPFQQMVARIAQAHDGEPFNSPHGDDFQLLFADLNSACRFASRLYRDVADLERQVLREIRAVAGDDLQLLPKLGLVESSTFNHADVQQQIHLCSQLINTGSPGFNDGRLLTLIPPSSLPSVFAALARPQRSLPGAGIVFGIGVSELESVA